MLFDCVKLELNFQMKIFKRLHWLVATTQGAEINNFSYRET